MSELEALRAENAMLRGQLVAVVTGVLAGCGGVTLTSSPKLPKELQWKATRRCDLNRRLQDVLASVAGPTSDTGARE